MKRDWDIIRKILQKAEELEPDKALSGNDFGLEIQSLVAFHVKLLDEAGLIVTNILKDQLNNPVAFRVTGLTWKGYDFLESIRSDSIWKKTKDKILEKGGAMTVDVIKTVALGFVKSSLGL